MTLALVPSKKSKMFSLPLKRDGKWQNRPNQRKGTSFESNPFKNRQRRIEKMKSKEQKKWKQENYVKILKLLKLKIKITLEIIGDNGTINILWVDQKKKKSFEISGNNFEK